MPMIQRFPVKMNLHKSTVVTPHTQLLYKGVQKHHPIKKKVPKIMKLLSILKKIPNNLKRKKIGITQMIMVNLLKIHY